MSARFLTCFLLVAALSPVSFASARQDAPMSPPPPADAPASAAPPPSATVGEVTVTARRPTVVSGVTVTAQGWCPQPDPVRFPADHDPTVVDSYPTQNAVAPPGAVIVRVSFDSAMSCNWAVDIEGELDDPCEKAGAWALPRRRSFLTRCTLAPRTHYVFHFRQIGDSEGFVGLSGRRAAGFDLAFDTSDAAPRPAGAPSLDPRPTNGEVVRAYVTCVDQGAGENKGACQRALVQPDAPPAT